MSAIRGKNTKPEVLVRKFLFSRGLRYRIHVRRLPGCPDIVLRKYRTVIFVDGCFWHGHEGCKHYRLPSTNVDFWRAKIERNRERDEAAAAKLRELGWRVIRLWECELSPASRRVETLEWLYRDLTGHWYTAPAEAPAYLPSDCPDQDDTPHPDPMLLPAAAEPAPNYAILTKKTED